MLLKLTLKLAKEAKWNSFYCKDNNFLISEVWLATRASAWGCCLEKKKTNKNPKHITFDTGGKRIKDYVSFALISFILSLSPLHVWVIYGLIYLTPSFVSKNLWKLCMCTYSYIYESEGIIQNVVQPIVTIWFFVTFMSLLLPVSKIP